MSLRKSKGFTLIELLVALGIVAVFFAILYQTFAAVIKTTEEVEEETEIYRMARLGLSIMTEELRSVYWLADRPTLFFVGTDGILLGQPADSLRFTALSGYRYGEGPEGPELAILRYGLEEAPFESAPGEGEEPRLLLLHEEETNALSLFANSRRSTELGERVWGLNFRYLDGDPAMGEWVDSWDASERKRLPRAVEIRLTFKDRRGREYSFFTRTDIPLASH